VGRNDEAVKAAISEAVAAMSKSFKVIDEPQKKGATNMISLG